MLRSYQWNETWTLELFSVRETKWLSVFTEYFPQVWRNFEKLKEALLYYVKDIQMLSMKWNLDFWNFENWNEVLGKASNSAIFRNWQIK